MVWTTGFHVNPWCNLIVLCPLIPVLLIRLKKASEFHNYTLTMHCNALVQLADLLVQVRVTPSGMHLLSAEATVMVFKQLQPEIKRIAAALVAVLVEGASPQFTM